MDGFRLRQPLRRDVGCRQELMPQPIRMRAALGGWSELRHLCVEDRSRCNHLDISARCGDRHPAQVSWRSQILPPPDKACSTRIVVVAWSQERDPMRGSCGLWHLATSAVSERQYPLSCPEPCCGTQGDSRHGQPARGKLRSVSSRSPQTLRSTLDSCRAAGRSG